MSALHHCFVELWCPDTNIRDQCCALIPTFVRLHLAAMMRGCGGGHKTKFQQQWKANLPEKNKVHKGTAHVMTAQTKAMQMLAIFFQPFAWLIRYDNPVS